MKLQELAVTRPTKQIAKVFESHFDQRLSFDSMNRGQVRGMLQRVRGLVNEHRASPAFHYSEKNPAYLKLMMMEQALTQQLQEFGATGPGAPGASSRCYNYRFNLQVLRPGAPSRCQPLGA